MIDAPIVLRLTISLIDHDYGGSVSAQVQRYQEDPSGLWQFPSYNYTKRYDIPGGGSVQIIFIDTTTLAPSATGATNSKGLAMT